jgi:alpha-L-arabinofuranosidase
MIRWPGENHVCSYNWKDAIGDEPELAWGGEDSNQFAIDEHVQAQLYRR